MIANKHKGTIFMVFARYLLFSLVVQCIEPALPSEGDSGGKYGTERFYIYEKISQELFYKPQDVSPKTGRFLHFRRVK
jgi:hypothetical protein